MEKNILPVSVGQIHCSFDFSGLSLERRQQYFVGGGSNSSSYRWHCLDGGVQSGDQISILFM
jgi:hypothetical protein